ncbi:MAG: Ldh family oxidoreductase [Thermoleophilia bacterium]|nr:Ldh family oxidoreductase [Thermoleophilia bacterium]
MRPEEARARLRALGFDEAAADVLFAHFADAERRGKLGHGFSRIEWLEALEGVRPDARPEKVLSSPGFDRWEGRGALGYLTLAAICADLEAGPPEQARVVVAADCFPTGMLGHYVRRLAEARLVALLTATSPARLPHPAGGPPLVGTNPLAIGVPAADGPPVVVDVSMGKTTYGDVLAGRADPADLVPFGGEQAHKAFALALGLQLVVESQVGGFGAFLVVLHGELGPVDLERFAGVRLPGR